VRQISIDKLEKENIKIGPPIEGGGSQLVKNPKEALCTMFLNDFIRPKEWQEYPIQDDFRFKETHILELIEE